VVGKSSSENVLCRQFRSCPDPAAKGLSLTDLDLGRRGSWSLGAGHRTSEQRRLAMPPPSGFDSETPASLKL
jgi:hypothetical protein